MAAQIEELQYRLRGIDEVSGPAKKASASLRQLGSQAQRSSIQMNQFGGAFTGAGKDMRKFALGGLQQAGYQIGDFAVQVANGTSRMQAFGQQAPQLLQIFGPLGAVAGAAVAVFAAFGVAAEKSSGASEKLSDKVKRLNEELEIFSDIAAMELQATMFDAADAVLKKWTPVLDLIKNANAEQLAKDIEAFKISLLPEDIEDQKTALEDIVKKSFAATSNINDQVAARTTAQQQLSQIAATERIINQLNGQTKEELQESFLTTVNRLKFLKLMTPELAGQLASFAQQMGIQSDIKEMMMDEITAQGKKLRNISGITSEMAYEDALMGQAVAKNEQSLELEANRKRDHEALRETLKREDDLFSLAVTKNAQSLALEQQRLSTHEAMALAMLKTRFSEEDKLMSQSLVADQQALNKIISDQNKAKREAAAAAKVADPLKDLQERIKLEQSLFGATEARRQVQEAIFQSERQYTPQQIADAEKLVSVFEAQKARLEQVKSISQSVGQSFENAFMSAVDGSQSVGDAFRNMAREIIKELFRIFVVKRITGFITGAIESAFTVPNVAAPSFAGGGYTGSGPRSGGVDGKGGFNAILHPNETVIDHTKGQGGGQVVVNQTINVSTGVQQTVRTEIKSLMPQIAESAKSAVMDAKRRGGSYGRSFA